MIADVVVVGAGIIGAACARELSLAGLRVTVIDRRDAAAGTTSSGEGNLLVSDKTPGPELALALYAAALWPALVAELVDELGSRFPHLEYEPKGGIVVATEEEAAAPLRAFAAAQRTAGVEARDLAIDQALALEPHLDPGIAAAVLYPQDAQVQPVVLAEALLASARRHGAVVRTHEEVLGGVTETGRVVGVRTSMGEVAAGAVLVAAGPWSGEVSAALGVPLPVHPRRGILLVTTRMPHRIRHKVYDGDYVGATQSGDAALQTSSVIESTGAGTVLIGSSREHVGFDDRFRSDVVAEIARKSLRIFPFLAGASVMRTYGGFRPHTPDHLPVIGEDPRLPGLWHATGHEGAGIGLSIATAHLIAAGMLGTPAPVDAAPFRVARPRLHEWTGEAT